MNRVDTDIIKCARRLINKLDGNKCRTHNGEYLSPVKLELKRMKKLCAPIVSARNSYEGYP